MRRYFFPIVLLLLAGITVHSCSLLKVSADFGVKPLSTKDLNARVAVRNYAANFTDIVADAADSVFTMAGKDTEIFSPGADSVRLASITWKMNATSACMNASLNSIPEGAVLNTWILVKGMYNIGWEEYFGKYGFAGKRTSGYLADKYSEVIFPFLGPVKFKKMGRFVDSVLAASPLDIRFKVEDRTYEWFKYSGVPDSLFVTTVGSISEVIADLNDRVGKYSVNASNQFSWGKDRLEYRFGTFLSDSTYKAGLDSLNHSLTMLKTALRNAPDKADSLIADINIRVDKMLATLEYTVNSTLDNTFAHIETERIAFMKYISQERVAIMNEGKILMDDSVKQLSAGISALIKNLLIYFLLFVFLLVGVPFYLGYRTGRRNNKP